MGARTPGANQGGPSTPTTDKETKTPLWHTHSTDGRGEGTGRHNADHGGSPLGRGTALVGRALACLARAFRAADDGPSPGEDAVGRRQESAPAIENDILWKAKRNAFRQALSQHDLTEAEACAILRSLVDSGRDGCELVRLADLTGLEAMVLDSALALMGLQNIVTIEERAAGVRRRPVVWVVATEAGQRFIRETAPASSAALEAPAAVVPGPGEGILGGSRHGVGT